MALQNYRAEVTKQSIAADFWAVSKFVCHLGTINSCPFDSGFFFFFGSTYLREEGFSQMKTTI